MPTREIPPSEWSAFFDSFSRQHQGWLVTIEVLAFDIGAQVVARELALQGITAEMKDESEGAISIMAGGGPEAHVTHTITAPTQVRLKQSEEGADEALEIESASATITLVRFRSAMPTEMVDGIL
jgi:hypothetical protein